jgi:hypothetical protein
METLLNTWTIASKPDNIPIVGLMFLVFFFTYLALRLAIRNDRLRSRNVVDPAEGAGATKGQLVDVRDIVFDEAEQGLSAKVLTWPHLVKLELLVTLFMMVLLMVWSIPIDAPLEEMANPGLSPNPAKAPWYFLGLQDMLVYFDPWIAGVLIPVMIIVGLMLIPYLDPNPRGSGYYTLKERKAIIATFFFGFHVLWILFIVIGTFLRGPGWMWFWPWETWDAHRVVSETNVNLNEFVGHLLGIEAIAAPKAAFAFGLLAVGGYYALGCLVPYGYLRRQQSEILTKMGWIRYGTIAFLFWSMMGLPIKLFLNLFFHIKYIWVTPWFNI